MSPGQITSSDYQVGSPGQITRSDHQFWGQVTGHVTRSDHQARSSGKATGQITRSDHQVMSPIGQITRSYHQVINQHKNTFCFRTASAFRVLWFVGDTVFRFKEWQLLYRRLFVDKPFMSSLLIVFLSPQLVSFFSDFLTPERFMLRDAHYEWSNTMQ